MTVYRIHGRALDVVATAVARGLRKSSSSQEELPASSKEEQQGERRLPASSKQENADAGRPATTRDNLARYRVVLQVNPQP